MRCFIGSAAIWMDSSFSKSFWATKAVVCGMIMPSLGNAPNFSRSLLTTTNLNPSAVAIAPSLNAIPVSTGRFSSFAQLVSRIPSILQNHLASTVSQSVGSGMTGKGGKSVGFAPKIFILPTPCCSMTETGFGTSLPVVNNVVGLLGLTNLLTRLLDKTSPNGASASHFIPTRTAHSRFVLARVSLLFEKSISMEVRTGRVTRLEFTRLTCASALIKSLVFTVAFNFYSFFQSIISGVNPASVLILSSASAESEVICFPNLLNALSVASSESEDITR